MHWNSSYRCNSPGRPAWTIVEVLVVISVISLLLALALPALLRARASASSTKCLTVLRSVSQASVISADKQRAGVWNNVFVQCPEMVTGQGTATLSAGSTSFGINYLMQVKFWQGPLIGVLWDQGSSGDVWSCPEVFKAGRNGDGGNGYNTTPIAGAAASYYYSAALFTDPKLWDPANPRARRTPEQYGRGVGMHEVAQPSAKVAFAETADHHGNKSPCYSENVQFLNAAFADGHCKRVLPRNAKPALMYTFEFERLLAWPNGIAVPFSSAAWGAQGSDF